MLAKIFKTEPEDPLFDTLFGAQVVRFGGLFTVLDSEFQKEFERSMTKKRSAPLVNVRAPESSSYRDPQVYCILSNPCDGFE